MADQFNPRFRVDPNLSAAAAAALGLPAGPQVPMAPPNLPQMYSLPELIRAAALGLGPTPYEPLDVFKRMQFRQPGQPQAAPEQAAPGGFGFGFGAGSPFGPINVGSIAGFPEYRPIPAPGGADTSRIRELLNTLQIPDKRDYSDIRSKLAEGSKPVEKKLPTKSESLIRSLAQGAALAATQEELAPILAILGAALGGGMADFTQTERETLEENERRKREGLLREAEGLVGISGLEDRGDDRRYAALIAQLNAEGGLADIQARNAAAQSSVDVANITGQNQRDMQRFALGQPSISGLGGGLIGIQQVNPLTGEISFQVEDPGIGGRLYEAAIKSKTARGSQPTDILGMDPRGAPLENVVKARAVESFIMGTSTLGQALKVQVPEYQQFVEQRLNTLKQQFPGTVFTDPKGLQAIRAQIDQEFLTANPLVMDRLINEQAQLFQAGGALGGLGIR